jgi:hypothetical protein
MSTSRKVEVAAGAKSLSRVPAAGPSAGLASAL